MDMQKLLKYLTDLSRNNEREWYYLHKEEYNEAKGQFETFLQMLILEIGKFDSSVVYNEPKDLTFKLVRDTRFSSDKSPYNPAFRAHISSKGKLPVPVGYYIMIKPDNQSFLGGGLFVDAFKDATTMVRDFISEDPNGWDDIIHASAFQEYFTVKGKKLKNVPKGYDREHPQAEFLKFKSWYVEYPIKDEELKNGEIFLEKAVKIFERMKPFNDYLNRALIDFKMPSR